MKNERKSARPEGARVRSQSTLRQADREFPSAGRFPSQHVIVLDAEGTLLHANQTLLDFYGRTLEEIQGAGTAARVKRTSSGRFRKSSSRAKNRLLERNFIRDRKRLLGKEGRYRWFFVSLQAPAE